MKIQKKMAYIPCLEPVVSVGAKKKSSVPKFLCCDLFTCSISWKLTFDPIGTLLPTSLQHSEKEKRRGAYILFNKRCKQICFSPDVI